ncbi:hypothetical protein [Marinobacter fonticola]|uniref:hypothetical protein n=1 Tax=Marinobacter fonticola TaxID=2603215 RepID=UPI0011E87613|nr:hypothetical protein [Marinobacter fonticola]
MAVSGTLAPVWAANTVTTEEKASADATTAGNRTVLTVRGISVQGDDDYPRVLNILPWQPPTISRRARNPLRLDDEGLLEPADPNAMEGHRQFRQTLNPHRGKQ